MTTARTPEAGPVDASIARLALLADPTRAALHRTLRDREAGITRDEAAAAVGVSRSLVAFHLDRLVDAGLATVTYERRNGRSGPGAGRPAKIYHRSTETVAASVPGRDYELAAALFAQAITASDRRRPGGRCRARASPRRRYGRALGEAARRMPADVRRGRRAWPRRASSWARPGSSRRSAAGRSSCATARSMRSCGPTATWCAG